MTFPSKLSVARIVLTFVVITLVMAPGLVAKLAALGTFAVAGLTDWLDGWLARRRQQTTAFGALLDPVADKFLVLGLFLVFVQLRVIPAWMVAVILLRELSVSGARLLAARRRVILAAAREGKQKTISQMVTIAAILTGLAAREWAGPGGLPAGTETLVEGTILTCLWVTLAMTVGSGVGFFWRHRLVLRGLIGRSPRGRAGRTEGQSRCGRS